MSEENKIEETVAEEVPAVEVQPEIPAEPSPEVPAEVTVEEVVETNPNVKVVEISGVKYNEIFNPADGTTRLEPLVD